MSSNNTSKGGYLSLFAGVGPDGKIVVPHAEGRLLRDGTYRPAQDGKKSVLFLSVAIGRDPWAMFGAAEAEAQRKAGNPVNADAPFITVALFDKAADELNGTLLKGDKIAFCGTASKVRRKDREGKEIDAVSVAAQTVFRLPRNGEEGAPNRRFVTRQVTQFTGKDGNVREQKLAALLSGTVSYVDTVKDVNGQRVLNFSTQIEGSAEAAAAVANGTFDKDAKYDSYTQIRWGVWGSRADSLAKLLSNGMRVLVTGTLSTREGADGKVFVNGSVRELSVLKWNDTRDTKAPEAAEPADDAVVPPVSGGNVEDFADLDEDDCELPF